MAIPKISASRYQTPFQFADVLAEYLVSDELEATQIAGTAKGEHRYVVWDQTLRGTIRAAVTLEVNPSNSWRS